MSLQGLNKSQLKSELNALMDKVVQYLNDEPDVDKFLDETSLFDDWEKFLPESEFPIFIMTVLNDIRKENIIDAIIDAGIHKKKNDKSFSHSKTLPNLNQNKADLGDHPFN